MTGISLILFPGEANKQLSEMRFKLQKSEQETSSLQAVVARLESQVVRYKSAAEASEKSEEALKTDRRKLQREVKLDSIFKIYIKLFKSVNLNW